jgi:hypothetical protein
MQASLLVEQQGGHILLHSTTFETLLNNMMSFRANFGDRYHLFVKQIEKDLSECLCDVSMTHSQILILDYRALF